MPLHRGTKVPRASPEGSLDVTAPLHPSPGKPQPPPAPTRRLQDPAPRSPLGDRGAHGLLPAPGTPGLRSARPWTGRTRRHAGPPALSGAALPAGARGPRKRSGLSTAMSGLPRSGRKCAREGGGSESPKLAGLDCPGADPPRRLGLPAPRSGAQASPVLSCSNYLCFPHCCCYFNTVFNGGSSVPLSARLTVPEKSGDCRHA